MNTALQKIRRVSAVYNHGESRASEPVVVDVKGVNAIAEISEADGVTVTAENGTIIVTGAEARSVAIAGIDGRIRYKLCTRNRPLGKVPEWSIGAVSKTVVPLRVPRVRIPVFPQKEAASRKTCGFFLRLESSG